MAPFFRQSAPRRPSSRASGIAPEGIRERIGDGVANHVLIFRAKKSAQAVGVHDVLPGHIRDRLGRNGRDLALPQKFQYLAHGPSSWNAYQPGLSHLDASSESQRLAAASDV